MAYGRLGTLGTGFGHLGALPGGIFVWPPHNLILASKDASNVADSANVTITVNTTTGPLGDATADQVAFSGSNNGYMYKSTSAPGLNAQTYCGSVYMKVAVTPVQMGMRCLSADGSGTMGTKVVNVTTAWQRFYIDCITGSTAAVYIGLDIRSFVTGDNGLAKTVLTADWQINRGTIPTAFVAV